MKKTIIPFALVAYEIVIANSALRASLFIYYLISNTGSRNNIVQYLFQIILKVNEKWGAYVSTATLPVPVKSLIKLEVNAEMISFQRLYRFWLNKFMYYVSHTFLGNCTEKTFNYQLEPQLYSLCIQVHACNCCLKSSFNQLKEDSHLHFSPPSVLLYGRF